MFTYSVINSMRKRPCLWRLGGFVQQRGRGCSSAPGEENLAQVRTLLRFCVDRYYISPGQTNVERVQHGLSVSYGPLGVELRRNLLDQWWRSVTASSALVFGTKTPNCSQDQDQDQDQDPDRREAQLGLVDLDAVSQILAQNKLSRAELIQQVGELLQRSPVVRTSFYRGALDQFVPSLELVDRKLPFGLAEAGPCFQPPGRSGRVGEATITSLVWFCSAVTCGRWLDHWARLRLAWWRKFAVSPSDFSSAEVPGAELEEAASRGVRIFYGFPWGQRPIETLWLRGNTELRGSELQTREGRRSLPHVVSVTGNLDLGMMAFLSNSLQRLEGGNSKHRLQQRTVLKLHAALAPVKVALEVGGGARAELRQLCEGLMEELTEARMWVWPGYLRTGRSPLEQLISKYDEMGVLFTVLLSENTLENGLLHVRSRDTTIRETVHISETRNYISRYISAASAA